MPHFITFYHNDIPGKISKLAGNLKTSVNETILKEDINRFLSYDPTTSGDPKLAAQKIIAFTEAYIKSINRALKIAGPFLSAAIKAELWKDLKKKFEGIKV